MRSELHKHFCPGEVSASAASTLHCLVSFWFALSLLHVQLLVEAV